MAKPTFNTSVNNQNTLASQVARIKDYIKLLKEQAIYLGETTVAEKFANLADTANIDNIESITKALLDITIQSPKLGEAVKALGETHKVEVAADAQNIVIPAGFYGKDTTFEIASLSEASKVDTPAVPADVVAGEEFWVNGEKKEGTLVDNSGKTVTASNTNTIYVTDEEDSNKEVAKLAVHVPTAKYNEDSVINTTIDVQTDYEYEAKVTAVSTPEGTTAEINSFNIPAGYYAQPIVIKPVFDEAGKTFESVINVQEQTVNGSGTYSPEAGYDYLSAVHVPQAAVTAEVASADYTIASGKAKIKFDTAGYTDAAAAGYEVQLPVSTKVSAQDASASSANADVTITPAVSTVQSVTIPAGIYTSATVVKVNSMADGAAVESVTLNAIPAENGDGKFDVSVKISNDGFIEKNDTYAVGTLNKSVMSADNVDGNVINAQTVTVSANEGYTKNAELALTVQDAVVSNSLGVAKATESKQASITINTTTDGWFTGKNIELSQANIKTLVDNLTTVEQVSYADIKDEANASISAAAGSYYDQVNMKDLLDDLTSL